MDAADFYMSLPYDVSGSRSKNRFRVELLWGISKMLDTYNQADFTMIFDYVCDIELHSNGCFEFYQLKSRKGTKVYTVDSITKIEPNSKNSILGKLYMLKPTTENGQHVKLAIVSNAYLKCGKTTYCDSAEQPLAAIDTIQLDKMRDSIKKELGIENCSFDDIYYICTPMNLVEPENDVRGKLIESFEAIEGCEPKKPNALWRLVFETVQGKACCELVQPDYSTLVTNKGITKAEFTKMLDCHRDNANDGVAQTNAYIEKRADFKERRKMKTALGRIVSEIPRSRELQECEVKISHYLLGHEDELPADFEETIDRLLSEFNPLFSIEYPPIERYVFCVLTLKRFEEGIYE